MEGNLSDPVNVLDPSTLLYLFISVSKVRQINSRITTKIKEG